MTAKHIWDAVQALLAGDVQHPFGPSTDYDVLADDGTKLPPKAVFGIAATHALGFEVGRYASARSAALAWWSRSTFRVSLGCQYSSRPLGTLA